MPKATAAWFLLPLGLAACACAQQPSPAAAAPQATGPRIQIEAVVTDKAGKPIPDLEPADFTLLDNNQPAKILSFHAYGGAAPSPVEVILLVDTMNIAFADFAAARAQVEHFLRQNNGHLPYPVSVDWVTENGVKAQAEPSLDGNALAAQLGMTEYALHRLTLAQGSYGFVERFQRSVSILKVLAQNEAKRPDKKLLIWIGPGWPMLGGPSVEISSQAREELFRNIVDLSSALRLAHISLDSVSQGQADISTSSYEAYLKGVRKSEQVFAANLSLKVLAVQTGGLVLPPSNDLTASIQTCIQDAAAFYSLSFEPPHADGRNEYHELKLGVTRPGLTVRTSTGYYNQPPVQPSR